MILIMSALQRRSAWIKLEIRNRNERWLQQLWGVHSIQASCEIPLTSASPKTCLVASTMFCHCSPSLVAKVARLCKHLWSTELATSWSLDPSAHSFAWQLDWSKKVHPSRAIFDNYNRQDDIGQTSVDPLNQQCAATNSHSYSFNSSEMATGSVLAWRWPKL